MDIQRDDIEYLAATIDAAPGRGPFALTLRFVNESAVPRFVDRRAAGLAGFLMSGVFSIEPKAPFIGAAVSLMPSTADDYVELGPGESLVVDLDLARHFDFRGIGRPRVTYRAYLTTLESDDVFEVVSNTIVLGTRRGLPS